MIVIFDSNYVCHVCYHGMGELSYKGMRTEVIFGFIKQIIIMCEKFEPDQIAFCWDSPISKRELIYPTYKLKRKGGRTEQEKKAFEPVKDQFNKLRDIVLPKLGFSNIFCVEGYESDDLIAALVKGRDPKETIIITSDEDLYQLLDNCTIYSIGKKRSITRKDFISEYGIEPSQWAEVKAIAGCSTDEVEGIVGVGAQTAILYMLEKITKGKKFDSIKNNREQIMKRNTPLVKLPFDKTPTPKLKDNDMCFDQFDVICHRYGFESLLKDQYLKIWSKMIRRIK